MMTNIKLITIGTITGLCAASSVFAGDANVTFNQHFNVHNTTGEKIVVDIQKGRYHNRKKGFDIGGKKRLKFNGLKEEVKQGCGKNCTNIEFTREFTLAIKRKDSSYWSDCSIQMGYYTTSSRRGIKSRYINSENCKGDIKLSGEDGKTLNIEIKGFNI